MTCDDFLLDDDSQVENHWYAQNSRKARASNTIIIKSFSSSLIDSTNDLLSDESQIENHCYARKSKTFEHNYY